jgi:hypothetical protein
LQGYDRLFGAFFFNVEISTNRLTSTSQKIGTQLLIKWYDVSISDATIGISVSNATIIATADASKHPCKGFDILSINFAKSDANQFGSIVAEIKEEANFIADTKTTIGAAVHKYEAPTRICQS